MSSQSETAHASSVPEQVRSSTDGEGDGTGDGDQPALRAMQPDEAANASGRPALELTQCPECGGRAFVSKLLVYEATSYDEDGTQADRRLHVQAEFELTCRVCQTLLRTLPAARRQYYEDVQVLAADRRAAVRSAVRSLGRRGVALVWAVKPWVVLGVILVLVGALVGL